MIILTVEKLSGVTLHREEIKMKKNNLLIILAAALAVGAAISCSQIKEEPQPLETPVKEEPTVYTLTVEAMKGTATKALTEDEVNHVIKSSWADGDNVNVYNADGDLLGTLTPTVSSTSSTTLSGNLDSAPEVDDVLTLKFRSDSYASQEGTLEYIATHCDYATAEVTVTDVIDKSITTTPAHFEGQQAIVKFTLQSGTEALNATELMVYAGTSTYTVTPAPPATPSVLYVALEGFSEQTVTLSAQAGSAYYDRTVATVTFENGKFYRVTVKMVPRVLNSISIIGLDPAAPAYYYGGALQTEAR